MGEIGRVYAPLDSTNNELMPGHPKVDRLFVSEPIPEQAWNWFVKSKLYVLVHSIEHGGVIDFYEEFWFQPPELPRLIALIETESFCELDETKEWLQRVIAFAKQAHSRGVSITFVVRG